MKQYILFGILLDLINCEKSLAKELAVKYEISVRTVYRYIDVLDASGVPVITLPGRNGGVTISKKYRLHSSFFTKQEIGAMTDLLKNCSDANLTSVFNKIRNY